MRNLLNELNSGDELTIKTIADLSPEPEEALEFLEMIVDKGIRLNIEDMGTIDRTPAGKQLLNTIVSMLG